MYALYMLYSCINMGIELEEQRNSSYNDLLRSVCHQSKL